MQTLFDLYYSAKHSNALLPALILIAGAIWLRVAYAAAPLFLG